MSSTRDRRARRELLRRARQALGIDQLVLMIHDASFPSRDDEDTGRGTPYSRGARDFLAWAEDQGFTGVQFGPQGETSASNPSPYDGAAFAKTVSSAALWPLAHDPAWEGVLDPRTLDAIVEGAPAARTSRGSERADHAYVYREHRRALAEAHDRARERPAVWRRFETFREANAAWLAHDARYEALSARYGTDDWRLWPASPEAVSPDDPVAERFAFGQFVVHVEHAELLAYADASGMRLYGDLAIGIAHRDRFERDAFYLRDYVMGAPPSRTNPEGQPWGYPVFVPGAAGPRELLRARVEKILSEFHGLRVDHPHGLVCPWVYDAHAADPAEAVARGARLFESPDLPDHPGLAAFAIARPDQLDRREERYADHWVRALDEAQIDAYAERIDLLVGAARARGREVNDILLEVLSTCPFPLERVMKRHGLGRFRITQKADPRNPNDVYATSRAVRGDWVMLGNHDTPPIWRCVEGWAGDGRAAAHAEYLARRLGPEVVDLRAAAAEPHRLAQLMFADLFACDAGHVAVFFADLVGTTEIYNRPGIVDAANWTLRVGNDYARVHAERRARGHALDVPRALAMALRARGADAPADLVADLERLAPPDATE